MKWSIVSLMFAFCTRVEGFAVSDIISNYAKVSVNDGSQHNESTPTTTITNELSKNDTEDEIPEYEDFDDNSATPERSSQSSGYDTNQMLNYFNGFVNLLALMYKFSGKPDNLKPESLHFSKSRPRSSDGAPLASSVNQLAEDRYNPNTATKKFKAKQTPNSYSTMNLYPIYKPSSAAETYSSNDGKTSYDADSSQYMISNPENEDGKPSKENDYKKNPMSDYITQNDPIDIQQSYSYEIPQEPEKNPGGSSMPSWDITKEEPNSWKSPKKPPVEEITSWEDIPHESAYYPWMKNSKTKMKPPVEVMDYDEQQSPKQTKMKPSAEQMDYEDEQSPKQNNVKDSLYYPWLSSKKPRPVPPPPEEEEEDLEDNHNPPSWGIKPPGKGKPPKNFDDHSYPYLTDHDDFHGVVYHGDHLDHHEEDHDMKDEDRESKRPYTYYHLGRKLWYVPLLFSLYFIVYIASLILKSIARHKVQFPEKLWDLHDHDHHGEHGRRRRELEQVTQKVYDSLDILRNKYK